VFCIINFVEVLWMTFVCTMQNKSHFEVCAILENCKMFWSFNILYCLQSMFCKFSMRTITSGGCYKDLPSQWAHYALMFIKWTRSNLTIKDNTISHYYYLHLQVHNHVINDFGVDCAIGQFVWSYIIARCNMLVKFYVFFAYGHACT
jgi:hypothetical protein